MASIDNVTVSDFKNLFKRDFPYLPVYIPNAIYFKGDVVYYQPYFYESKVDNNTTAPELPTYSNYWKIINGNVENYISDEDITRAFTEAKIGFNADLFSDNETAKMLFLYLAAHYLCIDLKNAMSGISGGIGIVQSKSVGSVSESYAIPKWATNNPLYSSYAQTGYGQKFLTLITPYLKVKSLMLIKGRINLG